MSRIEFFGKVEQDGSVKIWGKQRVTDAIATAFAGKNFKIIIEDKRNTRSNEQNRYYFGCVVPMIAQRVNEYGNDYTNEEIHDHLKTTFNKNIDSYLGIPKSTTRLTTVEFIEYMEKVKQWAADFLGVVIPEPNEQAQITF